MKFHNMSVCVFASIIILFFSMNSVLPQQNGKQEKKKETIGTIIPGKKIGNYILGQSLDKTFEEDTSENREKLHKKGIFLSFKNAKTLVNIVTTNEKFRTPKGIRVGSTKSEVLSVYGKPISKNLKAPNKPQGVRSLNYNGIVFIIHEKQVYAILVRPKEKKKKKNINGKEGK